MATQHTPGPWKLLQGVREYKQPHNEASHYEASVIRADVGPPWSHVCRLQFGYGSDPDLANAHLIAAAPELLKACQFFHKAIESRKRGGLTPDPTFQDWATVESKIDAAIALVTQQQ